MTGIYIFGGLIVALIIGVIAIKVKAKRDDERKWNIKP